MFDYEVDPELVGDIGRGLSRPTYACAREGIGANNTLIHYWLHRVLGNYCRL
eukprot:COSAG05_NODE_2766_length_2670_cov_4.514809_1_plen_52_part_00